MLRMLEAQAPAKQRATDTITTLSNRLQSATLLEDRRAAILGLRSFAKEYPASVASGSLRDLIACLTRDAEDVDTIKVVLETLLMLFSPNENSPEASDEIALWLADEFTQRQDNITTLLDLLEAPDFYPRLYSLQLLQAIFSARPERTQECILTAPLGIPRLVATLDDPRDAIRNDGLVLLTDLTQSALELQKLVAFENAFDRIFTLTEAEGSLLQGGIVVQDCLALLANLVRYNASNQSLFRETGGVAKLAMLLPGGPKPRNHQPQQQEEDDWVSPSADKNIWGLLAIIRLFLIKGSMGTQANQNAFHKHGLVQQILNLAFDPNMAIPTRAEALYTCADIIRGNSKLQESFAQNLVTLPPEHPSTPDGTVSNGVQKAYVIDALLDLVLRTTSNSMFDVRFAACECIKAYFYKHQQIKMHFLHRAIHGHTSREEELTANALTTLIQGQHDPAAAKDPYRIWFASVMVFHLLHEDPEAKHTLMQVVDGDAESGEEVVTCIQNITANLIAALQTVEDDRIIIAYLSILTSWLFEDADAVNDFLNEGSSLSSLVQAAVPARPGQPGGDNPVVQGLCSALLGTTYEFSTKDSPIPRKELQSILLNNLGRERYLDALSQLRSHPLVRDFEVMSPGGSSDMGGLPDVFFDSTFVEFLKDNFSRLSRAIDRDPRLEVHIAASSQEGVDRDLLDSLRAQLDEKVKALEQREEDFLTLERKLGQADTELRHEKEGRENEIERIKRINEALQRNHEAEMANLKRQWAAEKAQLEEQGRRQVAALNAQLGQKEREYAQSANQARMRFEMDLQAANKLRQEMEFKFKKAEEERAKATSAVQELEVTARRSRDELGSVKRTVSSLEEALSRSKVHLDRLQQEKMALDASVAEGRKETELLRGEAEELKKRAGSAEAQRDELRKQIEAVQAEAASLRKQVESLKSENGDLKKKLETATTETEKLKQQLEAATADSAKLRKDVETSAAETASAKKQAETAKAELDTLKKQADSAKAEAEKLKAENEKLARQSSDGAKSTDKKVKEAEEKAKKAQEQVKQAEEKAKKAQDQFKQTEEKAKAAEQKLKDTVSKSVDGQKKIKELEAQLQEAQKKLAVQEKQQQQKGNEKADAPKLAELEKLVKEKEEQRKKAQSELDDLLMLLSDLEEKRAADKNRLKALGQEVSDGEDEDDDEDDEEDDDLD